MFITKELNGCGETCLLDAYIFITRFFIIWKIQAIWMLQTMFTCFACIMCLKQESTSILNGSLLDGTTIPLGQQGTGQLWIIGSLEATRSFEAVRDTEQLTAQASMKFIHVKCKKNKCWILYRKYYYFGMSDVLKVLSKP